MDMSGYISGRKMIGLHSRSVTNEIDCKCHGVFSYTEPVRLTLSRVVGPLKGETMLMWGCRRHVLSGLFY